MFWLQPYGKVKMMDRTILTVKVDPTVSAAYIRVSDERVKRSVEVSDVIIVDLDEHAMVRGIELLDLDETIPYEKLEKDFHVDSKTISALKTIRPSISGFMAGLKPTQPTKVPAREWTRTPQPA